MKDRGGTDLETSPLLSNFHSAERRYAFYWRRKVIISHTELLKLQATIMTDLARHTHWCNSGISIMGVFIPSTLLLDRSPALQDKIYTQHLY